MFGDGLQSTFVTQRKEYLTYVVSISHNSDVSTERFWPILLKKSAEFLRQKSTRRRIKF